MECWYDPTSLTKCSFSASVWSEMEKMSVAPGGGSGGSISGWWRRAWGERRTTRRTTARRRDRGHVGPSQTGVGHWTNIAQRTRRRRPHKPAPAKSHDPSPARTPGPGFQTPFAFTVFWSAEAGLMRHTYHPHAPPAFIGDYLFRLLLDALG
jgi:hypothetical protein